MRPAAVVDEKSLDGTPNCADQWHSATRVSGARSSTGTESTQVLGALHDCAWKQVTAVMEEQEQAVAPVLLQC